MTILTPEIIEKAARAIHSRWASDFPNSLIRWHDLPELDKNIARSQARAALSAILPDIIEECAQQVIRAQYKEDAVAFIRELATKENENG